MARSWMIYQRSTERKHSDEVRCLDRQNSGARYHPGNHRHVFDRVRTSSNNTLKGVYMKVDSVPHLPAIYRRSKSIDLLVRIAILLLILGLITDLIVIGGANLR